jgi:hypothetical protein
MSDPVRSLIELVREFPGLTLAYTMILSSFLLFMFKRKSIFVYGICEIGFSGFLAIAIVSRFNQSPTTTPIGTTILGLLSAMYVGSRGWQNMYDGWHKWLDKRRPQYRYPQSLQLPQMS